MHSKVGSLTVAQKLLGAKGHLDWQRVKRVYTAGVDLPHGQPRRCDGEPSLLVDRLRHWRVLAGLPQRLAPRADRPCFIASCMAPFAAQAAAPTAGMVLATFRLGLHHCIVRKTPRWYP
jgi:hypothetical protein